MAKTATATAAVNWHSSGHINLFFSQLLLLPLIKTHRSRLAERKIKIFAVINIRCKQQQQTSQQQQQQSLTSCCLKTTVYRQIELAIKLNSPNSFLTRYSLASSFCSFLLFILATSAKFKALVTFF